MAPRTAGAAIARAPVGKFAKAHVRDRGADVRAGRVCADDRAPSTSANALRYDGHGLSDAAKYPIIPDDVTTRSLADRRRLIERRCAPALNTPERRRCRGFARLATIRRRWLTIAIATAAPTA